MKERIWQFLQSENKSSSQFADEIGVQPSGISHIISGRNNPSLDFIIKMLTRYQYLSPDWLLFGKGSMYKDSQMPNLFENQSIDLNRKASEGSVDLQGNIKLDKEQIDLDLIPDKNQGTDSIKRAEKVVYFYENGTFREYYPGKK
jgi:transcriptional regulator with XRE-family HTH domain